MYYITELSWRGGYIPKLIREVGVHPSPLDLPLFR